MPVTTFDRRSTLSSVPNLRAIPTMGGGDFFGDLAALSAMRKPPPAAATQAAALRQPTRAEQDAEAFEREKRKLELEGMRTANRDALMAQKAKEGPMPLRLVSGPQITPGWVADTNAMNAYQRAVYLPKESSFQTAVNTPSQAGVNPPGERQQPVQVPSSDDRRPDYGGMVAGAAIRAAGQKSPEAE